MAKKKEKDEPIYLIKDIHIVCRRCGFEDWANDSSKDFDKYYEMEDHECPGCNKRIVDEL